MRPLILAALLSAGAAAQQLPYDFRLGRALVDSNASYMIDSLSYAGIASNSIVDIQTAGDSLIFFGTSRGLSLTPDLGRTFRSYVAATVDLPVGSIAALTVSDSLVVAAALRDTTVGSQPLFMGAGLSYSTDLGDTWTFLDQPQEPVSSADTITISWAGQSVRVLAITTPVENETYDLDFSLGTIWLVSKTAGLRRYDITAEAWSLAPLPRDSDITLTCDSIPDGYLIDPTDRDPNDPNNDGNLNHRAFSVIAYDSLVWVGTAAGINKGIVDSASGCISWAHYSFLNDNISGDFVVALHRQTLDGGDRIWASTVEAGSAQRRGLSYTDDGGLSWRTTLKGKWTHNITSFGSDVYAATDSGLYKSPDGISWARFKSARDALTGERVYADVATGVLLDSRDSSLWVGSPDGLARTTDGGVTWAVERKFVSTTTEGEERFYAYPNPFQPASDNFLEGSGHVRFQYHIASGETNRPAAITIYDFALDPVVELDPRPHFSTGDFSQGWDGRNSAGFQVANGVYYCRLKIGADEYWTKVVVIN